MALSRIALIAALAAVPAAAAQAQPAAPDPVETQRESVREVVAPQCDEAVGDEIVVCGEREEEQARRYRVAPTARAPGAADRAGGEQREAMTAGSETCSTVGPNQRCTRGLDVIGIGFAIVRAVRAIRARRD